jgi:acyl-CoA synthetase (AMP-forming)/AMP-acid ligase II
MTPDTLVALFDRAADAHPDRPAVSDGDVSLTYRELARCADALAAKLGAAGIGPEDRVAVHMPRGVGVIAACSACSALVPPTSRSTWATLPLAGIT